MSCRFPEEPFESNGYASPNRRFFCIQSTSLQAYWYLQLIFLFFIVLPITTPGTPSSVLLAYFPYEISHTLCVSDYSPINFKMDESVFMKLDICIKAPEVLSLLGNGWIKTLPLQWIRMKQQENCWRHRFLCDPYCIKESRRLVLSRNFVSPMDL